MRPAKTCLILALLGLGLAACTDKQAQANTPSRPDATKPEPQTDPSAPAAQRPEP